jgi:hypothetical protein
MTTETWNPGHSLIRGYPYDTIVSRDQLVNRVKVFLEADEKISMDLRTYADPGEDPKEQIAFLMSRLFDTQEALKTAEQQIFDILEEKPFTPDSLGFELVSKPEDWHDTPDRMYSSKYDDRFVLYREPVDVNDSNWDTTRWIIMKKNDVTGRFDKIMVKLPCYRIAYAVLSSLGVVMRNEKEEALESSTKEERPLANPEE